MTEPDAAIEIALRIPGNWANPGELVDRLPKDCHISPAGLILPDGTTIGFGATDADEVFPRIFRSSCRREPREEELAAVDNFTVNALLAGPGGSLDSARRMMQAAAALVRAGGAGVFIDNSAMAHGGQDWLEMTADGTPDALSFAYVAIVSGRTDVWTMGMHVLGLRDIVMNLVDAENFDIIEVIRYVSHGGKPIENGHVLADLDGPRFTVFTQESDSKLAGSPMHNPMGRFKLVSMRDIAESN